MISNKKEKALKRYKVHGNAEDKNMFSRLRSKIKSDIDNSYKLYLAYVENNIQTNPNKFWSFIKAKNNSTSIPSSLTYENQTLEDPQLIVDSFAHYFSKSFTSPNSSANNNVNISPNNSNVLNLSVITEEEILQAIKKLKLI